MRLANQLPQALLAASAVLAVFAAPSAAATIDLERLQTVARQEGLPLSTIRLAGPHKLRLASAEPLPRAAFLKRAGLLAYVVYRRLPSQVLEIEFTNRFAGGEQTCRIVRADFERYIKDAIPKAEYERRLAYHERRSTLGASPMGSAQLVSAPPVLPVPPLPALGDASAPGLGLPALPPLMPVHPATSPVTMPGIAVKPAFGPLAVPAATMLGLNYGLALGGSRFDAYQLEYGHPVLPTLDLRPSVQIISSFSPLNYMSGEGRPVDGLSFACDLLGTTRQAPGAGGLAFEGGLGARMASLQGASSGNWPALHMRVGARWQGLTVGMRYPLLHRDGDPTGSWEASVGYAVPFSVFGGL